MLYFGCAHNLLLVGSRSYRLYHVQYFGHEREHGWLAEKNMMPYESLAHFNANCPEMKANIKAGQTASYLDLVRQSRKAAWVIATQESEEAYAMSKEDRAEKLTYLSALEEQTNLTLIDGLNSSELATSDSVTPSVARKKKRKSSLSAAVAGDMESTPSKVSCPSEQLDGLLVSPRHQQCLITLQQLRDELIADNSTIGDGSAIREALLQRWQQSGDANVQHISVDDASQLCSIVLSPSSPLKGI